MFPELSEAFNRYENILLRTTFQKNSLRTFQESAAAYLAAYSSLMCDRVEGFDEKKLLDAINVNSLALLLPFGVNAEMNRIGLQYKHPLVVKGDKVTLNPKLKALFEEELDVLQKVGT